MSDIKKVLPGATESAERILDKATAIKNHLEEFKLDFKGFFESQEGDLKVAASARQAEWAANSDELNSLLTQATNLAMECQIDLREIDGKLAANF
ncbi:hypothetical protein [Nocardia caishijiensis]|uniref:WXG100 family type VII secretion target n=1 Tax=Nocardia caishijiensis TaxID=184756 RepID=A0ABQ6YRN9_9NOCA|nr:hypothetical protein [Nocardia caishijiensis]KAF0848328.1 hypothetical protein FNL39_102476 [Nocardia caishijiensis]